MLSNRRHRHGRSAESNVLILVILKSFEPHVCRMEQRAGAIGNLMRDISEMAS